MGPIQHLGPYSSFSPPARPTQPASILLTIWSSCLRQHPGQRAFPGGRIDDGESAEQAALRELEEEVGLKIDSSEILGRLDDYATRSGFENQLIVYVPLLL
jgi:8-oxo-dGTP pyrophosphatase MutT (NUDIX family)